MHATRASPHCPEAIYVQTPASGFTGFSTEPLKIMSNTEVIEDLLRLARQEQQKGNENITTDKLDQLQQLLLTRKQAPTPPSRQPPAHLFTTSRSAATLVPSQAYSVGKDRSKPFKFSNRTSNQHHKLPPAPPPQYSPLVAKYQLPTPNKEKRPVHIGRPLKPKDPFVDLFQKFTFRKLERVFVAILEIVGNVLDNLHLFLKFPMFPEVLKRVLKNTNKIWVLILLFLIRKTVTQLRNVIRKERKVNTELGLLQRNKTKTMPAMNDEVQRRYTKVLKDLKFDKMMLWIELFGNFLDLGFNLIELWEVVVPSWLMNTLNVASMAMTIYRMNKDDEYLDDDITEDLL